MQAPLLSVQHVTKSFPGVKALDDVSLDIGYGEVVALLGENGAGKSTLIKILSGVYSCDAGEVLMEGKPLPMQQFTPKKAQTYGIATIYQELSVIKELSVADNIGILYEPCHKGTPGLIDKRKMNEIAKQLLETVGADNMNVKEKVKWLSIAQQQIVEICKALSRDCKLLIMDEPTTSLTAEETACLFDVIRMLKEKDVSIIYISHRMDEISKIADRDIVLRDGKLVGEVEASRLDANDAIVEMMTGRKLSDIQRKQDSAQTSDHLLLSVEHATDGKRIQDISLNLYEHEILGVTGLLGAQRSELFRMVAGVDRMLGGTVTIRGRQVKIRSVKDAKRYGIGYLSENRKDDGLHLGLTNEDNVTLINLAGISKAGVIKPAKSHEIFEKYKSDLGVKGNGKMRTGNLSGGNQQKVAIAKWLFAGCDILIFDEPTRGIDVAAKAEIYAIIRRFANQQGKAAIVISSEIDEIIGACDRVLVMAEGAITHECSCDGLNKELLLKYVTSRRTL